jgi:hypothetical protein
MILYINAPCQWQDRQLPADTCRFSYQNRVFAYKNHVFAYKNRVLHIKNHIFAYKNHVFAYKNRIFLARHYCFLKKKKKKKKKKKNTISAQKRSFFRPPKADFPLKIVRIHPQKTQKPRKSAQEPPKIARNRSPSGRTLIRRFTRSTRPERVAKREPWASMRVPWPLEFS